MALPRQPAVDVPLRTDSGGVIRIGQSRVTLQAVIAAHRQKPSPIITPF